MSQTMGFNGLIFPFLNTGTTVIKRYHAFRIGDGDSTTYQSLVHGVKVMSCAAITDATLSSSGNTGLYTQPPIAVAVTSIGPGQIGMGLVKGLAICALESTTTLSQGDDIILDQSTNDGKFDDGSLSIGGVNPTSGLLGSAISDSLNYPIQGGLVSAKQDFADNTTPGTTLVVCFAMVDFSKSLGLSEFQHTHS